MPLVHPACLLRELSVRFMALPSDDVLTSWNRIMRYQVDFSFPLELPIYLSMASWHAADRVLDLGSGDGYYLCRLASYFPDKSYIGIDLDERAIQAARTRTVTQNDESSERDALSIAFETADALCYTGSFSVAIARLLVQHLSGAETLFAAAPNFLQRDGMLIVIDSNDHARLFWPKETCGRINAFFQAFSEFQPGRSHSATMMQIAPDYGFEVHVHELLTVPSSIPTYKDLFHQSYRLFFEIVEKHYRMPFDYESLASELDDWAHNKGSYSQIGVNVCVYRFVG